ncbi:MAG: alpha-amylase family glycosyl hydrolase, partial [Anaerolineales bacterium]
QQPDLNWHNPAVKKAMWDAVRFWLDLGVDGYRLDAIGTIYEDPNLTPHDVPLDLAGLRHAIDLAKTPAQRKQIVQYWNDMFKNQWAQPGLHELMKELRVVMDEYEDRMLVGEDDNIDYMGNGKDELHLVFNFPLMRMGRLTPRRIRLNQKERFSRLDALPKKGWPCNTLGNHDTSRIHTFFGDKQHDAELARLHAALVLTLKGTPFLYNGEEIGMTDLIITDPTKLRDTMATWYYDSLVNGSKLDPQEAARRAGEMTRDRNRTPMQWSDNPNGGFSPAGVETWLPVNPNYREGINVKDQQHNPSSLLNYYKHLLRVRKQSPALIEGEYIPLNNTAKEYFSFIRRSPEQTILVIMNFSEKKLELDFSRAKEIKGHDLQILFSSAERIKTAKPPHGLTISPFEVFIAEVQKS